MGGIVNEMQERVKANVQIMYDEMKKKGSGT